MSVSSRFPRWLRRAGDARPEAARRLPSIRMQIATAIAGVALLVAALLLPVAQRQIDRGFVAFETRYAEDEARRLQQAFSAYARTVERTAQDYSRWDETFAYIRGERPNWLDEHLTPDVLDNFGARLIVVADSDLAPVGHRSLEPVVARHARALLQAGGVCAEARDARMARHRFIYFQDAPHVLVCSAVTPTALDEPVAGVMLWLLPATGEWRERIAGMTLTGFEIAPAGRLKEVALVLDGRELRIDVPIANGDGTPGWQATMRLPRPLGAQRVLVERVVLGLLLVALGAPALIALLLLEWRVVRRIHSVSRWVHELRAGGEADTDARLRDVVDGRAGFAELHALAGDVAALALHLENSRAGWRDEARRDSLTGLGNRARLLADLGDALAREGVPPSLLLIDLDGFKSVNDRLGHAAGDSLLADVGAALRDSMPAGAHAYRLGGDEFAVLVRTDGGGAPDALAAHLADALQFERGPAAHRVHVTASIGVAGAALGAGAVSDLLRRADAAMYRAKRSGRACWQRDEASTGAR